MKGKPGSSNPYTMLYNTPTNSPTKGGGGGKKTPPPTPQQLVGREAQLQKEADAFLKSVLADTSLDDVTKSEIEAMVRKGQADYKTALSDVNVGNLQGGSRGAGGTGKGWSSSVEQKAFQSFQNVAKKASGEYKAAQEGTAPKYRYRQYQNEMLSLMQDRPGRLQTVMSRQQGKPSGGGLV